MLKQLLHAVICGVLVYSGAVQAQVLPIQAEGPNATRTSQVTIASSNGITYAGNFTQPGSAITFTVSVPAAGAYTISSRYAAALDYAWTMSVYVNSRDIAQAQFPSTASWDSWSTQQVTVYLLAGTNTVAYRYDADDSGSIYLDYILVKPAGTPDYAGGSAAAAGLPSEVSVNKFTGTAAIHLPLYTVSIPGLELPFGAV